MSNCDNKALSTLETKYCLSFEPLGFEVKLKKRCGAFARSTGQPCKAKALVNGRCKNHGGLSTGPKTLEGRQAVAKATSKRMALGQAQKALEGFNRWLEAGGRLFLSNRAKARETRKRIQRLMAQFPNASRTRA
jgi:hypothetical protein